MAGGGAGSVVNGTPLRRHRAAVPAPLPDEVVQWEILVRVPAKELLRCRAACRSWRRLASDAAFLMAHHHKAWVLEDYEAEVWSSKYQIQLPEEEMMEDGKCVQCLYGKVVSEKGDMLLIGRICWSLSLFHCDNKGNLIQKFLWENADPKLLGISFKESLVMQPFFQRKDGSRVRLPRFLRGL